MRGATRNTLTPLQGNNNLGNVSGGHSISCTKNKSMSCECGCGCRCDNGDAVAPPGTLAELRYKGVGTYFNSSGGPGVTFDLAVTNLTSYRPWNSMHNGRSASGTNAQINMGADQTTTFAMDFYTPDTTEPFVVQDSARCAPSHGRHQSCVLPLPVCSVRTPLAPRIPTHAGRGRYGSLRVCLRAPTVCPTCAQNSRSAFWTSTPV